MRHHHRAAGEGLQPFLQRADGVHIKIVRRFVQQDKVRPALEQTRQVHPVALATRKHADFLLLVRAGETELRAIGTGVQLARSEF